MYIKNRNIFRISRFILLKLPWLYKCIGRARKPKKRILIIKIDAIGDYILFRNYIEILARSKKFREYEIDLVGNILWKEIALTYDSKFITRSFFINPDDLYNNPKLTLKIGNKLYSRQYEKVLQPTYSRTLLANGLAGLAAARDTIAFDSDDELNPKYKKKTDRFYNKRIVLPKTIYHEFERNRFFFEEIIGDKIFINKPSLPIKKTISKSILIFPGSGLKKRNWEKEKFLALINNILNHTSYAIILCGSRQETEISDFIFAHTSSSRITDRTGQTSLKNMIQLIANAELVVTNETSAVHIATACNTPSVCVQGGGHYGRFTPYPSNTEIKPVCVFELMPCFNCNWRCSINHEENQPFPCISKIETNTVLKIILNILDKYE
ncbi:MAG TPA: glycosyltransferase family 9 protein [Sphingobacteriaceae bacterium]